MSYQTTRVAYIASRLDALRRCETKDVTDHWLDMIAKHHESIERACQNLPYGSGFDNGTTFDFDASKPNRLVFNTSFHHMDQHGYYDGWSDHSVIVTPCLVHGFSLRITGRDRNEIKDYIADCFQQALSAKVDYSTGE